MRLSEFSSVTHVVRKVKTPTSWRKAGVVQGDLSYGKPSLIATTMYIRKPI